jgi:hypothetical protein
MKNIIFNLIFIGLILSLFVVVVIKSMARDFWKSI